MCNYCWHAYFTFRYVQGWNFDLEGDSFKDFADFLLQNNAITQSVSFGVSPSMEALSHIKPASLGTISDTLMYNDKRNTAYLEMDQDYPFLNSCIQGI